MSTLSRPTPTPRTTSKRPHVSSPSRATSTSDIPDLGSKRQKTVRTNTSTTGLYHPLSSSSSPPPSSLPSSSSSSSIYVSSRLSAQPDTRSSGAEDSLPADFFDMHTSTPTLSASTSTVLPFSDRRGHAISTPAAPYSEPASAIDEDEWAAFEADIAATTTEITSEAANALSVAVSATTIPSTAVISAAPTGPSTTTHTDEELTPTGYTESEAQLDRQDAENKLVEEFEAMEGLEGRVRRLKEKREELRVKAAGSAGARMDFTAADEEEGPGGADEEEGPGRTDEEEEEEEEEEDDDDDEEDDWIHYAR